MTQQERRKYWADHLRGLRSLAFQAKAERRDDDAARIIANAKMYRSISHIYTRTA